MRQSSINANNHVTSTGQKELNKIVVFKTLLEMQQGTSREISNNCVLDRWEVARRLPDLRKEGKVIELGTDKNQKYNPIIWAINTETNE